MQALEAKLDAWAAGYLSTNRLPCLSLAISRGGDVLLRKDWAGPQQPLAADCAGAADEPVYMMMSCTKVVTAVAALQLWEQVSRLSPSEPGGYTVSVAIPIATC